MVICLGDYLDICGKYLGQVVLSKDRKSVFLQRNFACPNLNNLVLKGNDVMTFKLKKKIAKII
jgi:hypothetical protein